MTSYLTNYKNPLTPVATEQVIKLLLFTVGSLNLALSIDAVKKVLNYLPVHGSGLGYVGVTHLDDQEITVVDLTKKLFHKSLVVDTKTKGYLILVKQGSGESLGLWVKRAPTLIDVPLSQMRVLPESYRRSDTLEMATHVVLLPGESTTMAVFVLDSDRLL